MPGAAGVMGGVAAAAPPIMLGEYPALDDVMLSDADGFRW